jgi:hypothetical protein
MDWIPYSKLDEDRITIAKEIKYKNKMAFTYKMFHTYTEVMQFLQEQKEPMNYYELIRNKKQRLYFDIDCDKDITMEKWNSELQTFVDVLMEVLQSKQCAIFSSTNLHIKHKFSNHIIILDKHINHVTEAKLYTYFLKYHCNLTKDLFITQYIDMCVYKSNQLMRIQNSEKMNSSRPKKLIKIIGNYKYSQQTSPLYFVQFITTSKHIDFSIIDHKVKENFRDYHSNEYRYPELH